MAMKRDPNIGYNWKRVKYWYIPLFLLGVLLVVLLATVV